MSKVSKLNALFLATAPVLGIYLFPGSRIYLLWVLTVMLFMVNLFSGNISHSIKARRNEVNWFWAIFIIGLFGTVVNAGSSFYSLQLFVNNLFNIILFFIAIVCFTADCDTSLFKRSLYILGAAAALICMFQRAQFLATGSFYKDFFLPWFDMNRDLENFSVNRVSAFFTEPAHVSIFLLPIYYLALKEKRWIMSLILAGGILFSGSTTGFLLLGALTVLYMVSSGIKKKYLLLVALLMGVAYYIVLLYFPDVVIDNASKLENTTSDNQRLLGALVYLEKFDPLQLLFGVGLNQLEAFLRDNGIFLIDEWGNELNHNYSNAVVYMIVSYGFVGFLFFIKYLYRMVKIYKVERGLFIYGLGILFSDQVLFNRHLIYLIAILLLSNQLIQSQEIK